MDPYLLLAVGILSFFLGFFGSVVGGAGLVFTPLLISLGIPPQNAVATVRIHALGPLTSSLHSFNKGGKVVWRLTLPMVLISVLAAFLAASLVVAASNIVLQRIIGIVTLGILVFTILNRSFGLEQKKVKGKWQSVGYVLLLVVHFIGHIISGATGIMASYVLMVFFGLTFLQSSGTRKVLNLAASIMSSAVFIFAGLVVYDVALALLIPGTIGSYLGPRYAIKKGEAWTRWLFIIVIFLLAMKLLLF